MLGGKGRSSEPATTSRSGLTSTRPDSKRNVPSARRVAGRAATASLGSFLEKFTPRRSDSAWLPVSRMMYQAGFSPDAVFTAPLYSGSVMFPLGYRQGRSHSSVDRAVCRTCLTSEIAPVLPALDPLAGRAGGNGEVRHPFTLS